MNLSISEFSEICQLPPQTLRFYHSEGLLVPAEVNDRTGYRSYSYEQVEKAMLVTVLRDAGLSVKLVRRAVEEPDAAPALLQQHVEQTQRERLVQDEAVRDARELLTTWPEPHVRHAPETTEASKFVPAGGYDAYDWAGVDAACTDTLHDLMQAVESSGATVSGTPWREWALGASRRPVPEGSTWLVSVPITADPAALAALPDDVEVQTFEARDELSIRIPGRSSMAKFGTAMSRLVLHPLDDAFVDMSRMRQVMHADGIETTMAICNADDASTSGLDPCGTPTTDTAHIDDLIADRFTARAQAVVAASQKEAQAAGHDHISTGHLVLGLLHEPQGLAAKILSETVTPERLRAAMAEALDPRSSDAPDRIPYTPHAHAALRLSLQEAQRINTEYVGTEHILLGILAELEGVGAKVLRGLGIDHLGVCASMQRWSF